MTTELEPRALTLKDAAVSVSITNQATYDQAVELGHGIKALRDEAEAHHRPVIDAAHKAHKTALAALARIDDPLKEAYRIVGAKVTAWDLEQAAIQRRLQAEADERARQQAEAEQQQAALEAIDAGACEEEVEAVLATPVPVPVVVAPPTYQRAAGVTKPRDNWSAEVTDFMVLVKAVAAGTVPILALQPNSVFLNQQAKSLKTLLAYPGVVARNTPVTAWTGRR